MQYIHRATGNVGVQVASDTYQRCLRDATGWLFIASKGDLVEYRLSNKQYVNFVTQRKDIWADAIDDTQE